ncbi:tumor necrosis factor receptor superfamily member 14-like [Clupea harengus]|uniref:Tumor necrosis factor receptor superfamily member 14-like n=1 Tax=Clupea harengus TaxID=7950 RepID=A0A8M1KM69_CLUHA|nr:tumor necrosis factor receptor superfamily member 14-like [Clupea harengus]
MFAVSVVMTSACGRAEYDTGQECCPMCSPGHYVKRHCTEDRSTTCLPCPPSSFTDKPNGLLKCLSCSVCDSSAGLRVKRACSSTSDSLCEPLEGHYCTDPIKDGCRGAVEHTKCSPGQYVNQTGTASTDTVCGDCVGDTYSDGSFTSCRPHTRADVAVMEEYTLRRHYETKHQDKYKHLDIKQKLHKVEELKRRLVSQQVVTVRKSQITK